MRAVRAAVGDRSRRRHRLTVLVLGLVVGLLGMYASCSQAGCASGSDCPDDLAPGQHAHADMTASGATVTGADGAGDHAAARAGDDPGAPVSAPATETVGHGAHGAHGAHDGHDGHEPAAALAMMCLAVLAVALALLWPALARTTSFLLLPRPAPARRLPGRTSRVGTGPPAVWQFSVIRC